LAHVNERVWLPAEAVYGLPERRTWVYPITEPEMQMLIPSTRGQLRLHDVTLFIFNPDGELALIRKHGYPLGGWRAPGGGIAPGESFVQGAEREAWEETGLSVQLDRYLLRVSVLFTFGQQVQPWTTHVVTARAMGHPTVQDAKEIETVRWGTMAELCGSVASTLLATGRGLFAYRVALHREAARLLGHSQ
jgi:8-oxo-dGTP pyrophosphatase MutT (NUDIX family)